ncbi:RAMP superfamily CRISPR-associated protein [Frankia sp. Cppng1_Ct_nod]|uniref:RAMP superfamily CRISPR-associated protein n=1 Tax=Frankia sp. Cppng1_Ct_nod TaxID=2897162 RepID=UPI00104181CE|nr:RAMP superfamily CRISPR-associated protein [Frankia sp. Cppng1_Ct_nod]
MSLSSTSLSTTGTAVRAGRPMVRRLRVRGWLRLETPLHVGGLGGDPSVDLALAVDGQSRLYVPGTSLAGALRAFAARSVADDAVLDGIWGNVSQNVSDAGWASRIIVHDGLVTADTDPGTPLPRSRVEARSGIGIDRVSGTVAHGFLYGRAVLPRGAHLRLEIDLESREKDRAADPATAMLGTLLRALAGRRVRLGAARTRGLGSVVLDGDPEIVEQRFDSLDGLLGALGLLPATGTRPAAGTATLVPADLGGQDPGKDLLTVSVGWRPVSPVMVRSGVDGFAVNALPLVSGVGPDHPSAPGTRRGGRSAATAGPGSVTGADQVALVLPGSSIKGALRSHAERIERTARHTDAAHPLDEQAGPKRSARFRTQLDELDAVRVLFGSAGGTPGEDNDTEDNDARYRTPSWGVGALGVDDCYATRPISGDLWRTLNGAHVEGLTILAGNGPRRSWEKDRAQLTPEVRERLKRLDMDQADHVAIDRWTGGAAEGRLYSTLEPHHVGWQNLELTVDLRRLSRFSPHPNPGNSDGNSDGNSGLAQPALALLLLVLRDLVAGRVRLGHGVNRGHGDVMITSIEVIGFPDVDGTHTDLDALLAEPAVAACAQRWRAYVDRSDESVPARQEGSRA